MLQTGIGSSLRKEVVGGDDRNPYGGYGVTHKSFSPIWVTRGWLRYFVRRGKTTWGVAEANGYCKPSRKPWVKGDNLRARVNQRAWFADLLRCQDAPNSSGIVPPSD